jgi:hypothetical protein
VSLLVVLVACTQVRADIQDDLWIRSVQLLLESERWLNTGKMGYCTQRTGPSYSPHAREGLGKGLVNLLHDLHVLFIWLLWWRAGTLILKKLKGFDDYQYLYLPWWWLPVFLNLTIPLLPFYPSFYAPKVLVIRLMWASLWILPQLVIWFFLSVIFHQSLPFISIWIFVRQKKSFFLPRGSWTISFYSHKFKDRLSTHQ